MARVVGNERSWAISLITEINLLLSTKTLLIKRAGGETTINTGTQTMFPDVILYGDLEQTHILQGWEIKMPDTLITDEAFIEDAIRKARTLNLNSCFIWNFTAGVLYVRDDNGDYQIRKHWNQTNHIRTRTDVELYKTDWVPVIEEILIELNEYLLSGDILPSGLGESISDSVMMTIINRNKSSVSRQLNEGSIRNTVMNSFLNVWWREVQEEYMSDERNVFDAYAKTLLLNWINKFIFAHMIKSYHNPAFEVEQIKYGSSVDEAISIFNNISEQCDFYNIFKDIDYNNFIPENVWNDLLEFNSFLTENGVATIEQNVLQTILENTVRSSQRTLIGQFTTPSLLAEILVKLTIQDINSNCLDPCCGTGTIPKAILNYKKSNIEIENAYSTTWASDKYSFPLQISNISLTDTRAINIPNRIFQSNAFKLRAGQPVNITNPENGEILHLEIPYFDNIISNLPFVPFELIQSDEKESIQRISNIVMENLGFELNRRNDLYTYLVVSLWEMLNFDGRLGIITSNSWLGTDAGKQFYEVIKHFYHVNQVFISGNGRWFENVDVVTTILILSKKVISSPNENSITTFGVINRPLSDFDDPEMQSTLINSALLNREYDSEIIQLKEYNQGSIDEILNMGVSINSLFHNIDWLLEIQSSLICLSDLFVVTRGERRGWDRMFYPEEGHQIEPEYIKRVLKNSRGINSLTARPDNDAFCCSLSIEELNRLGHSGALSWIRRFENGFNNSGRPLPESLRRANLFWYEMNENSTADIVTTLNAGSRLFYARFEEPTFINQRLIGLRVKDNSIDVELAHTLLNSMIGMFYLEASGFGRGQGALDLSKKNLEKTFLLNPQILNEQEKEAIINAFDPIKNREILSTTEEFEQEDRLHFERVVLNSFGIEEYFDSIQSSLLSLQRVRLSVNR